MNRWIVCLCAALWLIHAGTAHSAQWHASLSGAFGRASDDISFGGPHTDCAGCVSIPVGRGALAVGLNFSSGAFTNFEMAYSQRGGGFVQTTVFRPDGDGIVTLRRDYLEVSNTWGYRWNSRRIYGSLGVSPRLSFQLKHPWLNYSGMTAQIVPGIDPTGVFGLGPAFLFARYQFDLAPSYRPVNPQSKGRISDTTFYFGLGLDIGL